jgi:hypothetical protein
MTKAKAIEVRATARIRLDDAEGHGITLRPGDTATVDPADVAGYLEAQLLVPTEPMRSRRRKAEPDE